MHYEHHRPRGSLFLSLMPNCRSKLHARQGGEIAAKASTQPSVSINQHAYTWKVLKAKLYFLSVQTVTDLRQAIFGTNDLEVKGK